jgi:hypothetical protein
MSDPGSDEQLVHELLYGHMTRDKKRRPRRKYPAAGSIEERHAMEALARVLARLLTLADRPVSDSVLLGVLAALDPPAGGGDRRIVFRLRKKGRTRDETPAAIIHAYVSDRAQGGNKVKVEAAVAEAREEFGLSRSAIFRAIEQHKEFVSRWRRV